MVFVKQKILQKNKFMNKKWQKKQIYKNLTNLSQEKLKTIDNKKNYVKNDVMTTIIKCCRGEKKEA